MRTEICALQVDSLLFAGSEATMFAEQVVDGTIIGRMFPRAFALAESLSASRAYTSSPDLAHVEERLNSFICHMRTLGYEEITLVVPGYCSSARITQRGS